MPTKSVSGVFLDRAKRDPAYRAALIGEVLELIVEGDVDTAKSIMNDYVIASIGYDTLAGELGKKPESLRRMLGKRGNPTISNMSALLSCLKKHDKVKVQVEATI